MVVQETIRAQPNCALIFSIVLRAVLFGCGRCSIAGKPQRSELGHFFALRAGVLLIFSLGDLVVGQFVVFLKEEFGLFLGCHRRFHCVCAQGVERLWVLGVYVLH
jgi:hypothetical protein